MNVRSIATVIAIGVTLFVPSAQANTLQISDAQTLQSLRQKLYTVNADVTQAMNQILEVKNLPIFNCLALIHDQGQEVGTTGAAVGDLIALAVLMKDNDDELLVLRALRTWLTVLSNELPHAREVINGAMATCSVSATVNVKGQALLNGLSEWSNPVASLSTRVNQVVLPKR